MHLDEVTQILGEFGPYQRQKYFMICLFATVSAFHALNMVFVGAKPEHHCHLPSVNMSSPLFQNFSHQQKTDVFIPSDDSCHQYDVIETERYLETLDFNVTAAAMTPRNTSRVPCTDGYHFAADVYATTITSDFELVCDQKFWRSTSRSVFFAGRLVGAMVFGHLSDRFGRRPTFFVGVLVLLVAGVVASLAPSMAVFVPMYFLQGAAHTGAFLVSYTLSTELVGPNYRVVAGFVIQIFYGMGYIFLSGLAYFIREWRYLELAITLPALCFGLYWWFLPESVPWLLSRGRDKEAEAILMRAAKKNGVTLPSDVIQALKEGPTIKGEATHYSALDCLRAWRMAVLSLNVWFNWLINSFVFYGLALNSEHLSGNPYLNFTLIGLTGMLSYFLCLLVVNKVGRRSSLISTMVIGGVACIVAGCLIEEEDQDMKLVVLIFVMLGKFCITASYSIIYLMAAELFPTVVRNIGMGVASMSARIGGIVAPLVLELRDLWPPLPLLTFGISGILAGLLALLLPETMGVPLPQTLEDVKNRRFRGSIKKGSSPSDHSSMTRC